MTPVKPYHSVIASEIFDNLGIVFPTKLSLEECIEGLSKELARYEDKLDLIVTAQDAARTLVRKMHKDFSSDWDVQLREDGIYFCRNFHIKEKPCEYEVLFKSSVESDTHPVDASVPNPILHPVTTRLLIFSICEGLQEVVVLEWSPSNTYVKLQSGTDTPVWKKIKVDHVDVLEVLTRTEL